MKYLVLFMTIAMVLWLLNKLRQGSPVSTTSNAEPAPPPNLGEELELLTPPPDEQAFILVDDETWPNPELEQTDIPPSPPAWSDSDLVYFSQLHPEYEGADWPAENATTAYNQASNLPAEHVNVPKPEETSKSTSEWRVVSDEEVEQAAQEALAALRAAGLFPGYPDLQVLSQEVNARCHVHADPRLSSYSGWSYWHSFVHRPLGLQDPWLDQVMLLGFGPEAGYAMHNALDNSFTVGVFATFGESCRQLSAGSLQVETILWQAVDDQTYELRVDEQVEVYDITRQSLWTAPLQFIRMLNAKLPNQDRRFEALTLLPIFGEILVFYLNPEEKATLETKRGWQFFDWNSLEKGAP